VFLGGLGERVKRADRATDAVELELDEHRDGRRPAAHDVRNGHVVEINAMHRARLLLMRTG